MSEQLTLTVYVRSFGRYFMAQCAEYDVHSQGGTESSALDRFRDMLEFELQQVPEHVADDARPLSWLKGLVPPSLIPKQAEPIRSENVMLCGVNFEINFMRAK